MKINQEKYAEKLCCLYLVIYIYIISGASLFVSGVSWG